MPTRYFEAKFETYGVSYNHVRLYIIMCFAPGLHNIYFADNMGFLHITQRIKGLCVYFWHYIRSHSYWLLTTF